METSAAEYVTRRQVPSSSAPIDLLYGMIEILKQNENLPNRLFIDHLLVIISSRKTRLNNPELQLPPPLADGVHPTLGNYTGTWRRVVLHAKKNIIVHVSCTGLIRNAFNDHYYFANKNGLIRIRKQWFRVPNLILKAFFPPPDDKHTSVRINKSGDYNVENLHWTTRTRAQFRKGLQCFALNTTTNEIQTFNSINDTARAFNLSWWQVQYAIRKQNEIYEHQFFLTSEQDLDGEVWIRPSNAQTFSDEYLHASNKGRVLTTHCIKTFGSKGQNGHRFVTVTFLGRSYKYAVHQIVWAFFNNEKIQPNVFHVKNCPIDEAECLLNCPEYLTK